MICGKESRGLCFYNKKVIVYFCSETCAKCNTMIDKTPNEQLAIKNGMQKGGEYIHEIGKYDLSTFSEAEALRFCECVIDGFCESMQAYSLRETEFLIGLQKR